MRRYLLVSVSILLVCLLNFAALKMESSDDKVIATPIVEPESDDNISEADEYVCDTPDTQPAMPEPRVIHDKLIAHAGGAVYGYKLTNSLEALDNSYENGFSIFELDFECTSDGQYVLLHDWDSMAERMLFKREKLSYEEFHNSQTLVGLTLLDLDMLLDWLQTHEDCYIITDAKCGNDLFLPYLYTHAGDLAAKFIPQAYSFEEYKEATDLGFEKVILTLYKANYSEDDILTFAENNTPYAITIPQETLTASLLAELTELGIRTYAHTVNELYLYEEWNACGLYGIYTDYFCPIKWPY